jgi:hypothetical protein
MIFKTCNIHVQCIYIYYGVQYKYIYMPNMFMHINILSQHVIIPGAKCARLLRWGDAGCHAFELLRGAGDWSLVRF